MFLLKAICSYILILSFLVCCSQASKAPSIAKTVDSTTVPSLPPLSQQEFHHYALASKHFFDSLFMRGFNGSVLVAKNGEILYEKTEGFKEPRKKIDSINEHTPFHLASVSKTFTAMAVLKLWEMGRLDIQDDVSKYLTGFPYQGVKIQYLLSQRSGLSNYVHFMDQSGWDKKKFLTNQDLLQYINTHKDLVERTTPGKHFEYSNTNYALLALVIEKASGMSYRDFLTKTFFVPLKMEDSYVFSEPDMDKSMKSFKRYGRAYPMEYLDLVYGDKNIYSTTHDLLKWDLALRSGSLFKQSTLDVAYAPYSLEKPGKRNYGLGWRMILMPKNILNHRFYK